MRRVGKRDEERRVGRRKGKRMWRDKKRRQERIWNTIFLRDIVDDSIPNRMGTSYYHIILFQVESSHSVQPFVNSFVLNFTPSHHNLYYRILLNSILFYSILLIFC
jgi:hypothetical protein